MNTCNKLKRDHKWKKWARGEMTWRTKNNPEQKQTAQ